MLLGCTVWPKHRTRKWLLQSLQQLQKAAPQWLLLLLLLHLGNCCCLCHCARLQLGSASQAGATPMLLECTAWPRE